MSNTKSFISRIHYGFLGLINMTKDLDDEDDVFYGGGKSKAKKEQKGNAEPKRSVYDSGYKPDYREQNAPPPSRPPAQTPPGQQHRAEPTNDRDIESEITETRREKQKAAEIHDITIIRQNAAKHSAESAKLYKKYRQEEASMVKYAEGANKARRQAEGYEEKSKNATAKADEKQADLQYLEGAKAERTRVKIAKLHAKSAKLHAKSINCDAKAAKMTQKSAAKSEKAKALLEQSKTHEAEAMNMNKRADKLQGTMS